MLQQSIRNGNKSADDLSEDEHDKYFDIYSLRGLMKYKVSVELTDYEYNNFTSKHGVDFPEYLIPKQEEQVLEVSLNSIEAVMDNGYEFSVSYGSDTLEGFYTYEKGKGFFLE